MFDDKLNIFRSIDKPYLLTLIGPPNCGKSTFITHLKSFSIRKRLDFFHIISRDDIVLSLSGTDDYNKAWEIVDHELVNQELKKRFETLSGLKENVVIDMTNMNRYIRKSNNDMFKDHYKIAIVFNYNKQEILERNESRKNKKIPIEVIDSMINKYDTPTLEEGFDLIVKF